MLTDQFYLIAKIGHNASLWILILLSISSVAIILERWLVLRKSLAKSAILRAQLQEALQSNQLTDIEEIAKGKDSLEGKALSYGLRHYASYGIAGLEEIFTSYALMAKPTLEKNLNFLATVGANAPFIGLLGTVFGIMDAFRELASSQGDATAVMLGISKALVATAVGLIVAIPAVVFFNYFQKQVKAIFQSLESAKEVCVAYAKIKKGQ